MSNIVGIGDNSGGMDAAELIKANLAERAEDLVKRADELLAAEARVPKSVDNATDADKVSTFIRQCTALEKALNEKRTAEKEPYLSGGRAVDGYFASVTDPVKKLKDRLTAIRTAYDVAVYQAEQRRRAEEARIAREEADARAAQARAEAEAARSAADKKRAADAADQSAVAEVKAEAAAEAVKEKPAEMTRTRTDLGVTSSLRQEWVYEITEPKHVPRKYCVPEDKLLRAAVKAAVMPDGSCPLEIKGVRIFQRYVTQVR